MEFQDQQQAFRNYVLKKQSQNQTPKTTIKSPPHPDLILVSLFLSRPKLSKTLINNPSSKRSFKLIDLMTSLSKETNFVTKCVFMTFMTLKP